MLAIIAFLGLFLWVKHGQAFHSITYCSNTLFRSNKGWEISWVINSNIVRSA